jgi:ATP-dependent DNA ligase
MVFRAEVRRLPLGLKSREQVRLGSRNGKDFSRRFEQLARALEALPDETLIDGEILAVAQDGRPSFRMLQEYDANATAILCYAFDLPYLKGQDLGGELFDSRRRMLQAIVRALPDPIRYSETFDVPAEQLLQVVREPNLEGVVAKRRDSFYQPGKRSGAWVKLRADKREEFVIGGYVPSGKNFDAILVGRYEDGDFKYAASIRAGFTPATRQTLFAGFSNLETMKCPFSNLPDVTRGRWGEGITAEVMAKCCWLKPRLLVAVDFLERSPASRLRHASFVELLIDKHVGGMRVEASRLSSAIDKESVMLQWTRDISGSPATATAEGRCWARGHSVNLASLPTTMRIKFLASTRKARRGAS